MLNLQLVGSRIAGTACNEAEFSQNQFAVAAMMVVDYFNVWTTFGGEHFPETIAFRRSAQTA